MHEYSRNDKAQKKRENELESGFKGTGQLVTLGNVKIEQETTGK